MVILYVDIKLKQLRAIENEQRRYVGAYGKGSLSEELFNEKMTKTNASLKLIKKQIQESSQNRGEAVRISVDQLVEMAVFKIESLDFAAKRDIVERVIDKVIANPKEVKIWGHLPVNTEKVDYEPKHWHSKVLTQLPFELKLRMPTTDRGKRGYSNQYVDFARTLLTS